MKYRIYIDEVGNSDLNSSADDNHRYLCLTGVIVELDYVAKIIQPELEEIKTKFFGSHPDEPIILHRKELVNKKIPFHALLNPEVEATFNEQFLTLLKSWDFQVIGVVIDKHEHNQHYSTWKYDPYHYCQEILLERFRLFLNINDAKGDVMIESRGGKEDLRLKKSFRELMEAGTRYLKADELRASLTSLELKVKPKAANIAGLQLADLLAHAVRRYAFKTVFNKYDTKITFSDFLITLLVESKFFRYGKKIYGYGLKKLP
jgi:Protein of unknown function (DUF3800)